MTVDMLKLVQLKAALDQTGKLWSYMVSIPSSVTTIEFCLEAHDLYNVLECV